MNNKKRNEIYGLMRQLEDIKSTIESLSESERESFDNLPEGIQYSEKGERMEAAADSLDNAVSSLEETIDSLNESIEQ